MTFWDVVDTVFRRGCRAENGNLSEIFDSESPQRFNANLFYKQFSMHVT